MQSLLLARNSRQAELARRADPALLNEQIAIGNSIS